MRGVGGRGGGEEKSQAKVGFLTRSEEGEISRTELQIMMYARWKGQRKTGNKAGGLSVGGLSPALGASAAGGRSLGGVASASVFPPVLEQARSARRGSVAMECFTAQVALVRRVSTACTGARSPFIRCAMAEYTRRWLSSMDLP